MQITVAGHARASFPPERATLHLRLGFESRDKSHALQATTELVREIGDAVDWALTDKRRLDEERKVLTSAVRAAHARAAAMADAAGAGEVRFVELTDEGMLGRGLEGGMSGFVGSARALSAGGERAGIDLAPEDIDVATTVHARFETGPA